LLGKLLGMLRKIFEYFQFVLESPCKIPF